MKYNVLFLADAEKDINEIYEYISSSDSNLNADKLINKIIKKCEDLESFPNRGHKLPELEYTEGKDYIEIHYKPYRIIYRIVERAVFIFSILDGRRDLKDLLNKRLLR